MLNVMFVYYIINISHFGILLRSDSDVKKKKWQIAVYSPSDDHNKADQNQCEQLKAPRESIPTPRQHNLLNLFDE